MANNVGIGEWIAASYDHGIPFLQQIPRECADFFLLNSQTAEFDAGEVILAGDSINQYFCVLQSGRAQICGRMMPDGQYNVIAYLESGACFGEMSLICNAPTSNTIIAIEDACTVLLLPKDIFIKFLDENPSVMVYLYKVTADRLRAKNKAFDDFESLSLLASAKVLPFVDFAQTMEKSRITGTVLFESNGRGGFIAFQDGQMSCAKCGKLLGPDALEELLSWGEDTLFKLDTHVMPDMVNINQSSNTTSLILDALRNIDEKQNTK
ncbi:MAG: cyclic nucleotide-binding domain-containing protein [Fibrobacteraceae bacterium]|jgi:CRP-like cAMP-binding protein|nr:cyclic nucleotide-binding domain-containing protein [Fibrobacteraceae bacterium]MEE1277247.1 cyclic nucleotide-binding domain-containing protein [Fibrobacteraceae bacterium]